MSGQRLLRVLIVEDERSVLRSFVGVLDSLEGIEPHRASTPTEARRILEEVMIDVAFIDPRLPRDLQNREGFTLIQEIRGRYQTVPIVVGHHDQTDEVREAMKLGAEDYVLETEVEQRVPIILKELRRKLELEEALLDLQARRTALLYRMDTADVQEPVPVLIQYLSPDSGGSSDDELPRLLREMARKLLALPLQDKIGAITEALVQEAVEQAKGTYTEAGKRLGRHRKFVERSIKKCSCPGRNKPKQ